MVSDKYDKGVKRVNLDEIKECADILHDLRQEIGKAFYGHEDVVNSLIRALLCNGHVLLEGVPGIAKTLLVRTLASVTGCDFNRIQFTVDLLPSDIIGLVSYIPQKGFQVEKGPIFSNFILADEINRSPPKTQSAFIEAMQENQVTIGKKTYPLPSPFFVMATQNPIENEGVYFLPEAQIDRFLFKVILSYPDEENEKKVMGANMTTKDFASYNLKPIISPEVILEMQDLVHEVYLDERIKDYILKIVKATRDSDSEFAEYIDTGASPRASIFLYLAAKAEALMNGRNFVIPQDVKNVAFDVLRHRVLLNYRARVDKLTSEKIISEILSRTKIS